MKQLGSLFLSLLTLSLSPALALICHSNQCQEGVKFCTTRCLAGHACTSIFVVDSGGQLNYVNLGCIVSSSTCDVSYSAVLPCARLTPSPPPSPASTPPPSSPLPPQNTRCVPHLSPVGFHACCCDHDLCNRVGELVNATHRAPAPTPSTPLGTPPPSTDGKDWPHPIPVPLPVEKLASRFSNVIFY